MAAVGMVAAGYQNAASRADTLEQRRMLSASPTTPDFIVPEDAGVIDVTNWSADASLNADPAAGNNDYAALQAVLDEYAGTNTVIYLPPGEYEIDQQLVVPILASNRASAQTIIQGQNRDTVTIKLADDLGFDGAALQFQIITADAFRNAVRDLTIDIGSGNPEADGLRFTGSNQATVYNVHIQSSDPAYAGNIGLELGTGANGPLLVENVSVDGFDVGIRTAFQVASQAFEDISLSNQQVYGWANESDQNVFVRNLTSVNEVRAIQNFPFQAPGQNAVFTLVDSTLTGVGAAADVEAILTEERFYAANVATPGYQRPIVYRQAGGFGSLAGNQNLEGDYIEEYWSQGTENRFTGGTFELFEGSPDGSLRLEIKDAPEVPLDPDFANWANPRDFTTTNPDGSPSGIAGDRFDDSAAIQAAIDSGATTIYFPNDGQWVVDSTVHIRGNVQRLIGLEPRLVSTTGDGVIRIGDNAAETVVIERFAGGGAGRGVEIQHAGPSTVVARNLQGFDYRAVSEAPGDLFIYDVVNGFYEFRNQNVWARQLNVEGTADVNEADRPDQKILVDNANLWSLGLKIENKGTVVRTINGGRSELLGVYRNNSNFSDADNPAFVTVDAATAVVNFDLATAASNSFELWASETRDGVTRTSERFGSGHVYSAFDDADLWDVQQAVVIDNLDPEVTYTGEWFSSSALPGGYIDSDVAFSNDADATATFTPNLPVDGTYEVFTRWIDNSGGQAHSGHGAAVPVTINHAAGSEALAIDQRTGGGKWVSAGTYSFAAGSNGSVVIATEGTNAKSIADGVRFVLVEATGEIPTLSEVFPIVPVTDLIGAGVVAGGVYTFSGDSNLLANDVELRGADLSVASFTQGVGGEVTVDANGNWEYRSYGWFSGVDTFNYEVTNGSETTTGTVQIYVDTLVDPSTGELRSELTTLEQQEADATLITSTRVEEYVGDRASRLLGPGLNESLTTSIHPGHSNDEEPIYFTGGDDASVTFDLGGTFGLSTARIWNYNEVDQFRRTSAGATSLRVFVDADADGNAAGDNFTLATTIDLTEASGRGDYTGELFDLTGITARFVRLEVVDNYGGSFSGLSEVQFRGELAADAQSPEIERVFVETVSSDPNPDRRATSTLGTGLNETDNSLGTTRGHNWESAGDDGTPSITYDLSDLHEVGSVRIWNYNHPGDLTRGAQTIDVYTSNDNVTYELLTTVSLRIGEGNSNYNGEKFDLGGTTARYVRFDITESHGATGNVGLGNVKFFGNVIPAGGVIDVTSASTSNGNGAGGLVNIINGSGLDDAAEFHDNAGGNRYTSNFNTTPTLDFSFGQRASLDKIHVWNYTAGTETDRGIREVRLLTSENGVDYVDQGVFEIPRGSSSSTFYHAINFQLDPVVASDVRIEVISNWGDSSFTGLGEIRFFGNAIPATPTSVSLAVDSDLGFSAADNLTSLDNSSADAKLDFVVDGTEAGSTVAVLADGVQIGSAVATGPTTVVTTDGVTPLLDGDVIITARQVSDAGLESDLTEPLTITVETIAPTVTIGELPGGIAVESLDLFFSEAVNGFDLDDLVLQRDGVNVDLGGASLEAISGSEYRLSNLGDLTDLAGDYSLDFIDGETGITDIAGNAPANLDGDVTLIPVTRAYYRSEPTIVEHDDAFLLDSGEISLSFTTYNTRSGGLFSKDHRFFGTGGHLTIQVRRGEIEVRLQSTEQSFYVRGGQIESGQQHDVSFRFGDGGMQLFVDGVLVDSNDYTGGLGATSGGTGNVEDIVIGATNVSSNAGTQDRLRSKLRGRIADVRVSDGDGNVLFSEAVTPYDLSEGDNSFNGEDQFATIEHSEADDIAEGAIEVTFNTDDASLHQAIFSKDNRGYDDGGHVTAQIRDSRVEVRLQTDSRSFWVRSDVIESSVDYLLRFEFEAEEMRLYLDDLLVDVETRYSGNGLAGNDNDWIIGASQWSSNEPGDTLKYYFAGTIRDFRVIAAV